MKNKAIEYYKENVEGVPLTQDEVIESFCSGFLCAENKVKKVLRDTLNKYKSHLADTLHVKLTKVINQETATILRSKIETIEEIQNKLK